MVENEIAGIELNQHSILVCPIFCVKESVLKCSRQLFSQNNYEIKLLTQSNFQ